MLRSSLDTAAVGLSTGLDIKPSVGKEQGCDIYKRDIEGLRGHQEVDWTIGRFKAREVRA